VERDDVRAALAASRDDVVTTRVPKLLDWARRLQAIAQTGVAYGETPIYHRERYEQVRRVAAEMLAANGDVGPIDARLALETGHATPKLDVRGVVFRDEEILLVREPEGWSLPGGWVDVGESPAEATVREVLEESGYATRATKLLALQDRDRQGYPPHAWHVWKVVFLCELEDGEQRALGAETDDARFFALDRLPEPLRVGVSTRRLIERCYEHRNHPEWPTDFD
jgi:ADP-ribose pyrophosphatase YjhB (NUDIX family)